MLTPVLDPSLGRPLYEQLYLQLRRDIESGSLIAGEKLPSKRALSAHLKVSVVTVEGAYGQLLAEGYIRSEPKRGFFVSPLEIASPPAQQAPSVPVSEAAAAPVPEYDFATNAVDAVHFPFSTWAKLMRQVLTREDSGLLSAIEPQGVPALRAAIVQYLHDFRGITASPDQVVVGAGSEYLIGILFQLLGREGGYAVEDPGYLKVSRILAHQGALVCPIPLDDQGLRVDALRWSGARVVHVTPSHHYPLGTVMPVGRRRELLSWAAEIPERYIIEDDYDSEFRFSGRPIPTLQSIDQEGRVIYMNTFSQTISPSMRVGFMVLPPRLLERYRRELDFYACTVPALEQHVLARFLDQGYYEQHLSRMRKEYRLRRGRVLEAFRASPFAKRVTIAEQGAGLHFLLRLKTPLSDEDLRRRAEEHGVRLGFLSEYAAVPDPAHAHTLVVNYAGLDAEKLPEAMALLSKVFA